MKTPRKFGVAIVGLGYSSMKLIIPALAQSETCELKAVVSSSNLKKVIWQQQIGVNPKNCYSYEQFDLLTDDETVHIVFITLPNSMHLDFVKRAASAGKHVICEKPLALSALECQDMLNVCQLKNVKLAVAYRLCFDPLHRFLSSHLSDCDYLMMRGELGFSIDNSRSQWRLNHKLAGGGALMDLGIYGIQVACNFIGGKPHSVQVQSIVTFPNYPGIERYIDFKMNFQNGSCFFRASYEAYRNYFSIDTNENSYVIRNCFSDGNMQLNTTDSRVPTFPKVNQYTLMLDEFATSLGSDKTLENAGEVGKRDLSIVEAIYLSANTGKEETVEY